MLFGASGMSGMHTQSVVAFQARHHRVPSRLFAFGAAVIARKTAVVDARMVRTNPRFLEARGDVTREVA